MEMREDLRVCQALDAISLRLRNIELSRINSARNFTPSPLSPRHPTPQLNLILFSKTFNSLELDREKCVEMRVFWTEVFDESVVVGF